MTTRLPARAEMTSSAHDCQSLNLDFAWECVSSCTIALRRASRLQRYPISVSGMIALRSIIHWLMIVPQRTSRHESISFREATKPLFGVGIRRLHRLQIVKTLDRFLVFRVKVGTILGVRGH